MEINALARGIAICRTSSIVIEADKLLTMRKSAAVSAAVVVFSALFWAGATGAATLSDETVRLLPGAVTTVALSENPSTGYRWQINQEQSSNLAVVQVNDAGYERSSSPRIGAPGMHRWLVKALANGIAQIVFDYARPWEHGAPARRHTVRIEIGPSR
jgi:inhibitor of cysteine peptidase